MDRSVNSSTNASASSVQLSISSCLQSRRSHFIFTAFTVANMLLLPLFVLVLFIGCQRWRKQRSVSTAAMTSHSDIFTYNLVALELISFLGAFFYCIGSLTDNESVIWAGMDMFSLSSPGQNLLHLFTCVERYLAVVHPIKYLGLKQSAGVRVRNISTGCVWLFCAGFLLVTKVLSRTVSGITSPCLLLVTLILVSFCSLSVLCVLIRPGPGTVGGAQSKQRAFCSIAAIMGVLLLRFVGILIGFAMYLTELTDTLCVVGTSAIWLTLPGSLVLPLLFLHRARKSDRSLCQ
ncbi:uncharacterized protein LOC121177396 [Toxotes jaculatrix]|uniref:uncharacterized protein LOC121177396 n=1 Tax=Toxotes jaculatrix TaxID=941984 RepID=UPI001B3AB2D6|nr:uncharacterized protein LOC121177396 [Toxotes jaculatrix]